MKIMKQSLVTTSVLALISGAAFAGVVGSKHDMTSGTQSQNFDNSGNTQGQVCVYCHTPHKVQGTGGPLWNRTASNQTYTMYGTTLGGTTPSNTPGDESLACLGCHDGTVAIDSIFNVPGDGVGNNAWTSNTLKITGFALVGADLSDDHPVSLTYNESLASLNPKNSISPLELFGSDQLECASCHDVHDDTQNAFLRVDDAASLICTTCHTQ